MWNETLVYHGITDEDMQRKTLRRARQEIPRKGGMGVLTRRITPGLPRERRGHWEMQFWVKIDMNLLVWMVLLREEKQRFDLVI